LPANLRFSSQKSKKVIVSKHFWSKKRFEMNGAPDGTLNEYLPPCSDDLRAPQTFLRVILVQGNGVSPSHCADDELEIFFPPKMKKKKKFRRRHSFRTTSKNVPFTQKIGLVLENQCNHRFVRFVAEWFCR
jgi:hypothetical protein